MVDKIEQDGLSDEIENKLNSAINEAPEDGKQYARKDANWEEVEGGGMSDFKMEDATDASLNVSSNLDPLGYSWDASNGGMGNQGGLELTPAFDSFPVTVYANKLDIDGKEPPVEYFNGAEVDIYLDGTFAYTKTIAVESYVPVVDFPEDIVWLITWDGLVFQSYQSIKFVPTNVVEIPLQEGDTWVYNESEGKFKPTPAVPTVVVTEFPAEPDANTLYIKVV